MPDQPPVDNDRQVAVAVSNAFVQLVRLLITKNVVSREEVTAMLDLEARQFGARDRQTAATFTKLMSDAFKDGGDE